MKCGSEMARWCVSAAAGMSLMGAYATAWSDYAGQEITIPAGETWTVSDDEMAAYNAVTKITFADETATLEFTGTSTAVPNVPLSGAGVVKKSGAAAWFIGEVHQQAFTGTFQLLNGTVAATNRSAIVAGVTDSQCGTISVDGGSLIVPNTPLDKDIYQHERIILKGTGYNGQGALVINKGTTNNSHYRKISLADDAAIACEGSYLYQKCAIALNGHTLSYIGAKTGATVYQMDSESAPGAIRVQRPSNTSYREYYLRRSTTADTVFFPMAEDGTRTQFYLEPYTAMRLYVDDDKKAGVFKNPIDAELHVGEGEVQLYPTHRYDNPMTNDYAALQFVLTGPVKLDYADSLLKLSCSGSANANNEVVFTNVISGAGAVQISSLYGRVRFSATNAFTGKLKVYPESYGAFGLDVPGAIPNYSKFLCSGGRTTLIQPATGNSPWTEAAVAKLANESTWVNGAALSFDTCACAADAKTVTWTGAHPITNAVPPRLAAENGTTLTVTGTGAATNGFATFGAATVKFTGENPIHLGGLYATQLLNGMAGDQAEFIFDGAKNVQLPSNCVSVGSASIPVKMTVTNSLLTVGQLTDYVDNVLAYSLRLGVASGNKSILELQEGAVVTAKLHVATAGKAVGAVYQRAGQMVGCGYHGTRYSGQPIVGNGGHGYYELTGGTFEALCRPSLAYDGGTGIMYVDGGSLLLKKHFIGTLTPWFFMGYSGTAEMYIKSGLVDLANTGYSGTTRSYCMGLYSANGDATTTVAGEDAVYKSADNYHIGWSKSAGGIFRVNVNGGVYESVSMGSRSDTDATRANLDWVHVNFNGGTWKAKGSNIIAQKEDKNFYGRITVFEKGATVDAASAMTITLPFVGATGQGVDSIALPDDVRTNTFIAPPHVKIVNAAGDAKGTGASAYALFDSKTGKVTGVDVTSRGWDYTAEPTAIFLTGNVTNGTARCTLRTNVAGGFTKTGKRTVTLNAAGSSWGGTTTVAGGTLAQGVENALPSGANVVLKNGGTLDLKSLAATVASVTYGVGGGTLANVDAATMPETYAIEISTDELAAGQSVAFTANTDLAKATVRVTGDVAALGTNKAKYTIATTTGTFTGTPAFDPATLPPGWLYKAAAKEITLRYRKGTVLIVR